MRKAWFQMVLASAIIVFLLMMAGCFQSHNAPSAVSTVNPVAQVTARETISEITSNPLDYFPMDTGDEWTYHIMAGDTAPIKTYEELVIYQGEKSIWFPYRRTISAQQGQVYVLKIRVKGPQRKGQKMNSVETDLEVLRDDLGFFRDANGMFWGVMDRPPGWGVQFVELTTSYSEEKLKANYGFPNISEGKPINSYKIMYLWQGTGVTSRNGETLWYEGVDTDVVGHYGTPCYHFLREVPEYTYMSGFKDKGFSEHLWYAKGKGLVRLEQKIEGKTSMVWTLERFTPRK